MTHSFTIWTCCLQYVEIRLFFVENVYFRTERVLQLKPLLTFSSSTWQRGCNVIVLVTVLAMYFINKVNNYRIPAVRCLFHWFCIVSHTFIVNRSTKTSYILSLCCENERVMQFFLPPLYICFFSWLIKDDDQKVMELVWRNKLTLDI